MNQYTKEIEQLKAEFKQLFEESSILQPKDERIGLANRVGNFKMPNGRENPLYVIPVLNGNGKYEIEVNGTMLDDKCTFDTFRECNPHLIKMFDIKDERYHQCQGRMKQIEKRIELLRVWEKRENEQQQRDQARIKEIESKLTEKERLQGELEDLRNKYGQQ